MEELLERIKPDMSKVLDLLNQELEEYKKTGDREKLIRALGDVVLVKQFEAATDAEKIGRKASEVLCKRIASHDVSVNMLLRIVVSLGKSTEGLLEDLGATGRPRRREARWRGASVVCSEAVFRYLHNL